MAGTYQVINVTEDQVPDPSGSGDLLSVFDITFTLPDRTGQFVVQVSQSGTPVTAAYDAITAKVAEIEGIYGGASS